MNVTPIQMINNSIQLAKYKLSEHQNLGVKSTLDIFQVARLMDTIKYGDSVKLPQNNSIFYNISAN